MAGSRSPAAPASPTGGGIRAAAPRPARRSRSGNDSPGATRWRASRDRSSRRSRVWRLRTGWNAAARSSPDRISFRISRPAATRPRSSSGVPRPIASTASRVAFQLLIEAADSHVHLCTPYFLPDRALRRAIVDIRRRGVRVSIVVPGRHTDQKWVRLASRRMWGELLKAGVEIHEYRHTMTHAKVLVVDELWSVIGTTNIDNRSFEHNDEVNLAMCDPAVAARLLQDYARDVADSEPIPLAAWNAARCGRRSSDRSSGFWSDSSDRSEDRAPVRGRPDRHLQHPSQPRHGPAHRPSRVAGSSGISRRMSSRSRKSSARARQAPARPKKSARHSAWAGS